MDRKFKKLNLKEFTVDSPSKLKLEESLGDLGLGATKRPPKKYVPNVNAIRNKERSQNNLSRIEKPNSKPTIVPNKLKETFALFTEESSDGSGPSGTARIVKKERKYSGLHIDKKEFSRKSEKYSELTAPVVSKDHQEVDNETEKLIYNAIMADESSSPIDLEEYLPFKLLEWSGPGDYTKNEINPERKLLELLESYDTNPKISLWGFRSSFPFQVDGASSKSTSPVDFHLTDFAAGRIGKISIRKSGKIEAIFGNVKYEFSTLLADSYQTFVSINVDPEKNGEVLVLGEVDDSFMLCPNMDYLLQNECRK